MAKSGKPKVPPTQKHRSSGDTGVPQRGRDMGDDPRQAVESGEQDQTNRSRGRVIGESGEAAGKAARKGKGGKAQHWESGRHQAE